MSSKLQKHYIRQYLTLKVKNGIKNWCLNVGKEPQLSFVLAQAEMKKVCRNLEKRELEYELWDDSLQQSNQPPERRLA